jgi:hypothetical protein
MSAYLMVTLHTPSMRPQGTVPSELENSTSVASFTQHCAWNTDYGCKHWLNNLRLILLPWVSANRFQPWVAFFQFPS